MNSSVSMAEAQIADSTMGSVDVSHQLPSKTDEECNNEKRKKMENPAALLADQGQEKIKVKSKLEEKKRGNSKTSKEGVKVFSILRGKINKPQKDFISTLQTRFENLREVPKEEESNIIMVFCPIVSRAGTDIEAALKNTPSTGSKPTVLVVLHHTFDTEKTLSDSSKCVSRENLLTVDCLFYEDTGLLDCQRNEEAYGKVGHWLIKQGMKMSVKTSQRTFGIQSFWSYVRGTSVQSTNQTDPMDVEEAGEEKGQEASAEKSSSDKPIKYFINVSEEWGHRYTCLKDALKSVPMLEEVSTVEESEVIMFLSPAAMEKCKETDPRL